MAQPPTSPADPGPANPVLASTLLDDEELDGLIEDLFDGYPAKRAAERGMVGGTGAVLEIGVKEVDECLCGGVHSGSVAALSGEMGGVVAEVSKL